MSSSSTINNAGMQPLNKQATSTTTTTTTSAANNAPVNQAVNQPANQPIHPSTHSSTHSDHHSKTHSSHSSNKDVDNQNLNKDESHKGGLMSSIFGSGEKHHDKSSTNTNQSSNVNTNNHVMDAGINTVRNRHSNSQLLTNSLRNYVNQLQSLNQTRQTIAAAFAAVLGETNSPYTQLALDYQKAELSMVGKQAIYPDRMIDESATDFDKRNGRINELLDQLNKQRGSVDHYSDKLAKLLAHRDSTISSGKTLSQSEIDKLERNQRKASDAENAYNQTNDQLIEEINYLNTAPVQHFGPALVAFISGEQMRAAQQNAALSNISIDASGINTRADMWSRTQPVLVPRRTGSSRISGLHTNVTNERSGLNQPTGAATTTTTTGQHNLGHTDKHAHGDKHVHSDKHTDQHHTEHHANRTDRDVNASMGTTMIRSEEQLAVGTERVVLEQVMMHKYVTSEVINVPITVRKEHLSIQRVSVAEKDRAHYQPNRTGSMSQSGSMVANTGSSTANTGSTLGSSNMTTTTRNVDSDSATASTLRAGSVSSNNNANLPAGSVSNTSSTGTNYSGTGTNYSTTGTNYQGTGSNVSGTSYAPSGANVTGTGLTGANVTGTGLTGASSQYSNTGLSNNSINTYEGVDSSVSGEWDFTLSAEQPVLTTRVVPYERVRIRKINDQRIERVSADLRKENVDFTLAPNLANQGQPEVAIRDVDPTLHKTGRGLTTENVDGNGLTKEDQAALLNQGANYNKDDYQYQQQRSTADVPRSNTRV